MYDRSISISTLTAHSLYTCNLSHKHYFPALLLSPGVWHTKVGVYQARRLYHHVELLTCDKWVRGRSHRPCLWRPAPSRAHSGPRSALPDLGRVFQHGGGHGGSYRPTSRAVYQNGRRKPLAFRLCCCQHHPTYILPHLASHHSYVCPRPTSEPIDIAWLVFSPSSLDLWSFFLFSIIYILFGFESRLLPLELVSIYKGQFLLYISRNLGWLISYFEYHSINP